MGHRDINKQYVEHSLYGTQPIKSNYAFSKEEIERGHWRYSSVKYFPETAIPADISKQQFTDLYPRTVYVDIEVECQICSRPFIFFALEQQHWFEELNFWIDAHCTRCLKCRKHDQAIRLMQKDYQQLVNKIDSTEEEEKHFKKIALELFQLGYIKKSYKKIRHP